MDFHILIVDDEEELCLSLSEILTEEGYRTLYTSDPRRTLPLLERERVDLIILDIRMPGIGGIDLLKLVRKANPNIKVIILTGHPSIENAVLSMKYGAADFFEKPPNLAKLLNEIREFAVRDPAAGCAAPRPPGSWSPTTRGCARSCTPPGRRRPPPCRCSSPGRAAPARSSSPAWCTGPARARTAPSSRSTARPSPRPCWRASCSATRRGPSPAPSACARGKFELADGGTIFLDEIGDMSPHTQARILRVLQEQEFERVGGSETIRADLHVIAATNKDLRALIQRDLFREDLYYRLCVITLHVPPLRERGGDVELLVDHFVRVFGARYGKPIRGLDPQTRELLLAHTWPGNVRELKNCIERAAIFCEGERIGLEDLPAQYMELESAPLGRRLQSGFEELNRTLILEALEKSKGKKSTAAELLNINRRTLYNRMRKLGLS